MNWRTLLTATTGALWNTAPVPAKAGSNGLRPQIPNVPLVTHQGRRVRFYDDLIRDRVVLINFMFVSCHGICPRTNASLARVQAALGEHLGRDVFLYSLTLDPVHDTPAVLEQYSTLLGARPGWTFLTGEPERLELLRRRLGFTDPDPKIDADKTQHGGLVLLGDDAAGRWTVMPSLSNPDRIANAALRLLAFR